MGLDEVAGRAGLTGTALVTEGDRTWHRGDLDAQYVIFSLTKPVIAAAFLLLAAEGAVDLEASAGPLAPRWASPPPPWPRTCRTSGRRSRLAAS
jgi:CubicO group peptidase (beta-lactamase class C family)